MTIGGPIHKLYRNVFLKESFVFKKCQLCLERIRAYNGFKVQYGLYKKCSIAGQVIWWRAWMKLNLKFVCDKVPKGSNPFVLYCIMGHVCVEPTMNDPFWNLNIGISREKMNWENLLEFPSYYQSVIFKMIWLQSMSTKGK
jgi:hypothetical protein